MKRRFLIDLPRLALCVIVGLSAASGVSAKSPSGTKPLRLRGIRQSAAAPLEDTKVPPPPQQQARGLTTMYGNQETGHHISLHQAAYGEVRTPAQDSSAMVALDVQADEAMVAEMDQALALEPPVEAAMEEEEEEEEEVMEEVDPLSTEHMEMEEPSVEDVLKEVGPIKEEPKGLYVSGKNKAKTKVKGVKTESKDDKNGKAVTEELEPEDEEEKVEEYDGEGAEDLEQLEKILDEEEAKPVKEEAEPVAEVHSEPEPVKEEKAEKAAKASAPAEVQSAGAAKGKSSSKGSESSSVTSSSVSPEITEITVGVQYSRKTTIAPSTDDYAKLAQMTSHVCDYIFRTYFEDIEEAKFLSTDKLAIFDVKANDYIQFTVAAYFDTSSAILPDQKQLTDIVVRSLQQGSSFYEYYLWMLGNLDADNAFASTDKFDLFSESTSLLTGPGEQFNVTPVIAQRATSGIFKVVVPIVVVLLLSVVLAMIYMNWVESHELSEQEGEILNKKKSKKQNSSRRQDPRKRLHENRRYRNRYTARDDHSYSDAEHSTLPSIADQSSFGDADAASVSESSARFVDDVEPPTPRKNKQVRVSPLVHYRTFTPGEFASRVDFEEVNLRDDDDDDDSDACPIPLEPRPKLTKIEAAKKEIIQEETSMTRLMDDFARVINAAPYNVSPKEPPAHSTAPPSDVPKARPPPAQKPAPSQVASKEPPANKTEDNRVLATAASIPWDEVSKADATDCAPPISRAHSSDPDGVIPLDDHSVEKRGKKKPAPEENADISADIETKIEAVKSPSNDRELDENMSKFRSAESRQILTGESTDMEEEFEEEEVGSHVEEVTVMSEYEEEVIDDHETAYGTEYETVYDAAYELEEDTAKEVKEAPKPEQLETKPSTDEASVVSEMSNSKLPPQKLRDFWEKKSVKQEKNVRDFWEQKSRPKKP